MTTVTPESRYVITEMQTREVTYTLEDLSKATGVHVDFVMQAAARGRLTPLLRNHGVKGIFLTAAADHDYAVDPSADPTVNYTVLDPTDPNGTDMPLAEGTLRQLDELLMPGTYQALRDGTGDPITLVVG